MRDLLETTPAAGIGRRRPVQAEPVTLARLERGRKIAAALVLKYGDAYLPIFERLDAECAARQRQDDVLARVRAVAKSSCPQRTGEGSLEP